MEWDGDEWWDGMGWDGGMVGWDGDEWWGGMARWCEMVGWWGRVVSDGGVLGAGVVVIGGVVAGSCQGGGIVVGWRWRIIVVVYNCTVGVLVGSERRQRA